MVQQAAEVSLFKLLTEGLAQGTSLAAILAEALAQGLVLDDLLAREQWRLVYTSDVPLGANVDFDTPVGGAPGDFVEWGDDSEILVAGIADQASDVGGVLVEESLGADTVRIDRFINGDLGGGGESAAMAANEGYGQIVQRTREAYRFRHENNVVAQGLFRVRVWAR